jgi:hypothetical protein
MSEDDFRDDVPEADRIEQQQEAWPEDLIDDADEGAEEDRPPEIDPLQADEADQLDQAKTVFIDDQDDDAAPGPGSGPRE